MAGARYRSLEGGSEAAELEVTRAVTRDESRRTKFWRSGTGRGGFETQFSGGWASVTGCY